MHAGKDWSGRTAGSDHSFGKSFETCIEQSREIDIAKRTPDFF